MNVPFAGPFSLPSTPAAIVATEVSLSVMVVVAVAVPMVTSPPVTLLIVALNVSSASTISSLLTGTVNVNVLPAAAPAGNVKVPLVVV
ncbi:hypothetical protein D3C85_1290940 [compost metagenome]